MATARAVRNIEHEGRNQDVGLTLEVTPTATPTGGEFTAVAILATERPSVEIQGRMVEFFHNAEKKGEVPTGESGRAPLPSFAALFGGHTVSAQVKGTGLVVSLFHVFERPRPRTAARISVERAGTGEKPALIISVLDADAQVIPARPGIISDGGRIERFTTEADGFFVYTLEDFDPDEGLRVVKVSAGGTPELSWDDNFLKPPAP